RRQLDASLCWHDSAELLICQLVPHRLELGEEPRRLRAFFASLGLAEFLQQFLLPSVQLARRLDVDLNHHIAVPAAVQHGHAGAAGGLAGVANHLAGAAAGRTGLLDDEDSLARAHLPAPLAHPAAARAGTRLCAAAAARFALDRGVDAKLDRTAMKSFLEAD